MIVSFGLSRLRRPLAPVLLLALGVASAAAEPIRHPAAVFAGLDKTTGRIINFDVAIDETVQFGTLQVTPRVCNTRPQTETPQTTSFVEVDEQALKPDARREGRAEQKSEPKPAEAKRIFSGWMFAASPGLHGVEHPVYDVWLVDCKGGKETAAAAPAEQTAPAADAAAPDAPKPAEGKKKRARKVEPAAPPPVEAQPIGPADGGPEAEPLATPIDNPPLVQPDAGDAPAPAKPRKKRKPKPAPEPVADPIDALFRP